MPTLVKDKALVYGCEDVAIVPAPTEIVLAEGFIRLEREGLLDMVFHEGTPSLSWFLQQFTKERAILACYLIAGPGQHIPIGFTWLNNAIKIGQSGKLKTESGHCYFRKTHPRHALLASAMSFEWIFDRQPDLVAVYGSTPEKNRAAMRFLRRISLETFGPIQNYTCYPDTDGNHVVCGATISCMTRERWQEVRKQFFS